MVLVERKAGNKGFYSCKNQVASGPRIVLEAHKLAFSLLGITEMKPSVLGWANIGHIWELWAMVEGITATSSSANLMILGIISDDVHCCFQSR